MSSILDGAIAPWLVVGLGVLALFTLAKCFIAWRQRKRFPYFFMRRQAERALRYYLWTTFALVLVTTAGYYVVNIPEEAAPRVALIMNAKPVPVEDVVEEALPEGITIISYEAPVTVDISVLSYEDDEPVVTAPEPIVVEVGDVPLFTFSNPLTEQSLTSLPALPTDYDQYQPDVELRNSTGFSPLVFALDIDQSYEPISPRRVFGEGFFTVYATFFYEAMADGMSWSWVWRYNGEIVNGGNELWAYGDEGPGWIYYAPPEGFAEGAYTLEVWVNSELFAQSSISVEPGVANQ